MLKSNRFFFLFFFRVFNTESICLKMFPSVSFVLIQISVLKTDAMSSSEAQFCVLSHSELEVKSLEHLGG